MAGSGTFTEDDLIRAFESGVTWAESEADTQASLPEAIREAAEQYVRMVTGAYE